MSQRWNHHQIQTTIKSRLNHLWLVKPIKYHKITSLNPHWQVVIYMWMLVSGQLLLLLSATCAARFASSSAFSMEPEAKQRSWLCMGGIFYTSIYIPGSFLNNWEYCANNRTLMGFDGFQSKLMMVSQVMGDPEVTMVVSILNDPKNKWMIST